MNAPRFSRNVIWLGVILLVMVLLERWRRKDMSYFFHFYFPVLISPCPSITPEEQVVMWDGSDGWTGD